MIFVNSEPKGLSFEELESDARKLREQLSQDTVEDGGKAMNVLKGDKTQAIGA